MITAGWKAVGEAAMVVGCAGGVATMATAHGNRPAAERVGIAAGATALTFGVGALLARRDGAPVRRWLVDSDESLRAVTHTQHVPAPARHALFLASTTSAGALFGSFLGAGLAR